LPSRSVNVKIYGADVGFGAIVNVPSKLVTENSVTVTGIIGLLVNVARNTTGSPPELQVTTLAGPE